MERQPQSANARPRPESLIIAATLIAICGLCAPAAAQYTDEQIRSSGPGHPWQASLPGINLYSRARHTELALFSFQARGDLAVDVALHHNSKTVEANPAIGGKWRHSYDCYLKFNPDGTPLRASIAWGDGTVQTADEVDGVFVPADGYTDELTPSGNGYALTKRDTRMVSFFEPTSDPTVFRLKSVTDRNGNQLKLTYDAQGRLTRVTDPANRQVRFVYNATTGKLTQIKHQVGTWTRVWKLTYNAAGNLASVKWPAVTEDRGAEPVTRADWYAYDARGNITRWTDRLGKIWKYGYDAADPDALRWEQWPGNTAAQRMEYLAPSATVRRVIDPRESVWTYEHDSMGRLEASTDPYAEDLLRLYLDADYPWAPSEIVTPSGVVTRHDYDTRAHEVGFIDAFGNRWDYQYDGADRLVRALEPLATDAWGAQEPARRVTDYVYDAAGRPTLIMCGWLDYALENWTYAYDARGQLVSQTDPLGNTTTYAYDSYGNLVSETSPAGRARAYEFVGADATFGFTLPSALVNGAAERTDLARDEWGRLITAYNQFGNESDYSYDGMGRLVRASDPAGTLEWAYNQWGQQIECRYIVQQVVDYAVYHTYRPDGAMDSTTVTSPNASTTTRLTLGRDDRLLSIDADGDVTNFTYDADARLVSRVLPSGARSDYFYDSAGRRTGILHADSSGADIAGWTYSYQQNGALATAVSITDDQILYGYDALNRLVREERTGSLAPYDLRWTYDAAGRRVLQDHSGLVTQYQHDPDGLVLQAFTGGQSDLFNWDGARRLVDTVREGDLYHYAYDHRDRLVSVEAEVDGFGWLPRASYSYDALDRRVTRDIFDQFGFPALHANDRYAGDRLIISEELDRTGHPSTGVAMWAHGVEAWKSDYPDGSTTQWAMTDLSGSLRAWTDESGNAGGFFAAYNAFGQTITEQGERPPFAWGADAGVQSPLPGTELVGPDLVYLGSGRFYDPAIAMTTWANDPGVPQGGDPELLRRIVRDGIGDACDNCPNVIADPDGPCDDGHAETGYIVCQDPAGGCPFRPKRPRHMDDCRRCHKTQAEELAEHFYERELEEHLRTCPTCNPPKSPSPKPGSGPSFPPDNDPRWVWMGGSVGWVYRTPGGGGIPY